MADDPSSTNFANNGAILMTLLSAGALLFAHTAPLQDARPESKELQIHETASGQDVDARLWQDPFTAVAREFGGAKTVFDCSQDRHCDAPFDQLGLSDKKSDVPIIVATESAAPYTEDEEARRRVRYALVSGLDAADFVPADPLHIGYYHPKDEESVHKVVPSELPNVIPFELFRGKRDPGRKILVLWLDEDMLAEHPLKKLNRLARLIGDGKPAPVMQVIGPSTSDTLRDLMIEACDAQDPTTDGDVACNPRETTVGHPGEDWPSLARTIFYAYRATVNDASLLTEVRGQTDPAVQALCYQTGACPSKYSTVHDFLESRGVHLLRTIATDDLLARAVIKELYLRGVYPGPKQHIALISEWDSYYGRTLPQLVQDCAVEGYDPKLDSFPEKPCPHFGDKPLEWVHKRTYLHGLDGALPKNQKDEAKKDEPADSKDGSGGGASSTDSEKDAEKNQLDSKVSERAFGQGQYDYLRRLASDLKEEDDQLQRHGGRSIGAIGVVGGDVFDKLLVLRALKPEFPRTVFFTDNFDALLTLDSELSWTRNLLVASSFGPKLNDNLQKDLPPFRDVAETSAFLATQLAVRDIAKLKPQEEAPRPPQISMLKPTAWPLLANISNDAELNGSATEQMGGSKKASGIELASLAGIEEALGGDRFYWTALFGLAEGRAAATGTSHGAGYPPDALRGEQNKITEWLQKPRIFEVERTGGMLALTEERGHDCRKEPLTCLSIHDCREDPLKCNSIQPSDPPLFPEMDKWVKIILGAMFTLAWVYGCAKMAAQLRIMLGERERSYEIKSGRLTFERVAFWCFARLFAAVALAGLCALAVWGSWPAPAEWITNQGEPMRLFEGVSLWPSVLIRTFTLALAGWLIFTAWRKLEANLAKIGEKFALPPADEVISAYYEATRGPLSLVKQFPSYFSYRLTGELPGPNKSERTFDVGVAWRRYVVQSRSVARFWRIVACVLIYYFALHGIIRGIVGHHPYRGRGEIVRNIYHLFAWLDVITMLFLIFFVVDATLLCLLFVTKLAKSDTAWPEQTRKCFMSELRLRSSDARSALDDWIDVNFIARRTSCIAGLIYFPLLILALMIVCHSSIFGNFSLGLPNVITTGIGVAFVVGCAIMLNLSAERARKIAKKHLADEIVRVQGSRNEARAGQWQMLLDRVTNMREGSFLPFLQQPVVGAVLLPLGSIGWTALFEGGHLFGL